MPYQIDKIVGTKRYRVINKETRKSGFHPRLCRADTLKDVKAKYSTLRNAQNQVRLLNNIEKSPMSVRFPLEKMGCVKKHQFFIK